MKKGARYLRFSSDKQNALSIDRQELVTAQWMTFNKVSIVDTFVDDGHSAKNFDRPDMKRLMAFVRKSHRDIDFLVVAELTRFSRDLGDAVNLIRQIQNTYGIRIVSAGRSAIYDVQDANSFFMMSLEFLMGHSENLKREADINGGIYTAKAKEGRYIGAHAPVGYKKDGKGRNSRLVIDPEKAPLIVGIFDKFLSNYPLNTIYAEAVKGGLPTRGNSVIAKILANPVYAGMQYVKAWKDLPGGMFPAKLEAIVNPHKWNLVQKKLKNGQRSGISLSDELPLRGLLLCSCGQPVTGAPSRNRHGNYYYYYKCKHSRHMNLSARKAHTVLDDVLELLSIPKRLITAIQEACEKKLGAAELESRRSLVGKKVQLSDIAKKLESIEEKYIDNKIAYETYTKWLSDLRSRRAILMAEIEDIEAGTDDLYAAIQKEIELLENMKGVYHALTTAEKQQMLRIVFDSTLTWTGQSYRTLFVIPALTHNKHIFKAKGLIFEEQKREILTNFPSGGAEGFEIEPLFTLIQLISSKKTAS